MTRSKSPPTAAAPPPAVAQATTSRPTSAAASSTSAYSVVAWPRSPLGPDRRRGVDARRSLSSWFSSWVRYGCTVASRWVVVVSKGTRSGRAVLERRQGPQQGGDDREQHER